MLEIGLDKTESSKKIGYLCKKSYFIIRNNSKNFFEGYYFKEIINKENNENQEKKTKIKIDTPIEQRDRAQLTKKLKGDEEKKNFRKFDEKVNEINNIYDLVEEI